MTHEAGDLYVISKLEIENLKHGFNNGTKWKYVDYVSVFIIHSQYCMSYS